MNKTTSVTYVSIRMGKTAFVKHMTMRRKKTTAVKYNNLKGQRQLVKCKVNIKKCSSKRLNSHELSVRPRAAFFALSKVWLQHQHRLYEKITKFKRYNVWHILSMLKLIYCLSHYTLLVGFVLNIGLFMWFIADYCLSFFFFFCILLQPQQLKRRYLI